MKLLFYLIAIVSGMSGLGSEVLYFKLLDFSLGSAPIVAFTVVASFITGIGLGSLFSARVKRPWLVEFALFLIHVIWIVALEQILSVNAKVLGSLSPELGPNIAAAILGWAYAFVPAVLHGITLPVIIERLRSPGRAYLLHAFGAVLGIVAIETIVVSRWGLVGALSTVALLHFVNTILLLRTVLAQERVRLGRPVAALLAVGLLTGALQSIWMQFAELLCKPFLYVQPVVVAIFLTGITLGTLVWERLQFSFERNLRLLLWGIIYSTLAGAMLLFTPPQFGVSWTIAQLTFALLPLSMAVGPLFPSFVRDSGFNRSQAGGALVSIGFGNAAGIFVASGLLSSLLLPLHLLAALAITCVAYIISVSKRWQMLAIGCCVVVLTSVAIDLRDYINRIHPGAVISKVDASFMTPMEIVAVYAYHRPRKSTERLPPRIYRRLYQSGYSPIGLGHRRESVVGAVGAAYASAKHKALVIGAGSGRTAGAAALVFDAVDVVDISANTVPLLEYLGAENFSLRSKAHVRILRMDGVLAPRLLEEKYDLVILTTDPSFLQKAAKLYYKESLQALGGLLNPGGVLVFWADSTVGHRGAQILVNTARDIFQYQKLFSMTSQPQSLSYFLLVNSDEPLVYDPDRWRLLETFINDSRVQHALTDGEHKRLISGRYHSTQQIHSLRLPALDVLVDQSGEL